MKNLVILKIPRDFSFYDNKSKLGEEKEKLPKSYWAHGILTVILKMQCIITRTCK